MNLPCMLTLGMALGMIATADGYQRNNIAYNNKLWSLQHNEDYYGMDNNIKNTWKKATQKPIWKNEMKRLQWKQQRPAKPQWWDAMNNANWWNPGPNYPWQTPATTTHWYPPSGRQPGTLHPGYHKRVWPDYIPPVIITNPRLDDPPEF